MSTQSLPSSADRLLNNLSDLGSCLVAFSGGVDSAVVAKAACLALSDRAVAATGVSASLAQGELQIAERIAEAIGIRHVQVKTDELADADYLANQPNRCWHCKDELYSRLSPLAEQLNCRWIVNGANVDDLGDFRPGMKAATKHLVRSPLAECGIDKATVREMAKAWNLEVWDKPATPCLSSRVVYGLEITPERLERIDAAERFLRAQGLGNVRVRYHQNDLARLEVALEDLAKVAAGELRTQIAEHFRQLGFKYITLDLEGFRSGSFHHLVPSEELVSLRL